MKTQLTWLLLGLAASAAQAEPLSEAITGGDMQLALRYRFEHVDQDGFSKEANASTLRARLNYRTGSWNAFSTLLEFDAVEAMLIDDYNSGAGTSSARRNVFPVVADQDYTEVNQIYLQFDGLDKTRLRVGRQRIMFDNRRFIGNVGWRQNEQTYDGVSLETGALGPATVSYAYIANVNRIFGNDVAAGDHDNNTHLFNVRYPVDDNTGLTGYVYAIDNNDSPAFSTTTYGLRFTGKPKVAGNTLAVNLEVARQNDAANNPVDFSAVYYNIDGALSLGSASLLAGFEMLEGSGSPGKAFRTPLATLHAFNGWADVFLTTPDDGLRDSWIGVSTAAGEWSLKGVIHRFEAQTGGRDFGNEIDLSAGRKAGKHYSLLVKLARFNANDPGLRDTGKIWFMASANY